MCATCVAQGIGYVGSALVGLQVMGARAKSRRRRSGDGAEGVEGVDDVVADAVTEPVDEPARS
jgi:hypothetical protein